MAQVYPTLLRESARLTNRCTRVLPVGFRGQESTDNACWCWRAQTGCPGGRDLRRYAAICGDMRQYPAIPGIGRSDAPGRAGGYANRLDARRHTTLRQAKVATTVAVNTRNAAGVVRRLSVATPLWTRRSRSDVAPGRRLASATGRLCRAFQAIVPKIAPTTAVATIANAPHSVTRPAPTATLAPPTFAASPPSSARSRSDPPATS